MAWNRHIYFPPQQTSSTEQRFLSSSTGHEIAALYQVAANTYISVICQGNIVLIGISQAQNASIVICTLAYKLAAS